MKMPRECDASHEAYVKKEVLIIGGGPGGMAAAEALADIGISDILLVEKESFLGGVLPQCIHDGFGLTKLGRNISGPEYAELYRNKIAMKRTEVMTETTAMEITDSGNYARTVLASPEGEEIVYSRAVIVATGCRERGRGEIGIAGARATGIFTAGTAQAFVNLRNLMIGKKIVILGSGDIGLIMARRLTLEGAEVVCVVEKESVPGGLPRNVAQCLEDYGIPLYLNTTITEIFEDGQKRGRVSGVELASIDDKGQPRTDTARRIDCDTLILSVGLVPENGIIKGTGNNIFLCGNALFVHSLVDDVSDEGEVVAREVFNYLKTLDKGENSVERHSLAGAEPLRKEWRAKLAEKKRREAESRGKGTITCILCPNGCEIEQNLQGGLCERGAEYVRKEIQSPERILTSSVKLGDSAEAIISVRTTQPIPKERIKEAMKLLSQIKVEAPVKCGDVIERDFIVKGVDLITTKSVK